MKILIPKSTSQFTRALSRSCATLALALSVHPSAQAANDYTGTLTDPSDWSIAANWSAGHVPLNGEDVTIGAVLPPGGSANVTLDVSYSGAGLNSLTLNPVLAHIPATLNQTAAGSTMIAVTETIATDDTATYNQNAGTNVAGTLTVGELVTGVGSYNLDAIGNLVAGAEFIGRAGIGTFNQSGGVNSVSGSLTVGFNSGSVGTFNQTGGVSNVSGSLVVGSNSGSVGIFNQSGGSNIVSGSLVIGSSPGSTGTYNLTGGTLKVDGAGILNKGTFNITGGALTGGGAFTNNGTLNIGGTGATIANPVTNGNGAHITVTAPTSFTGHVTNSWGGTFKNTASSASFPGGFTNGGAFISDPATNQFADLTIETLGTVQGGAGDVFSISGDLLNQSTEAAGFDIDAALLVFTGATTHRLTWPGVDFGAGAAGYADNFAVGIFELASGAALDFVSGALYVSVLDLDGGLAQADSITGGGRIYYDPAAPENAYLAGGTYGGGIIAPIPEPGASALLAGALLLGAWRRRGAVRAA